MPVKSRRPKRRRSNIADLDAWSMLFETGCDFFGDLGFRTNDEAQEAAREAWHRLGRRFLETYTPTLAQPVPWALEVFGDPRGSGR